MGSSSRLGRCLAAIAALIARHPMQLLAMGEDWLAEIAAEAEGGPLVAMIAGTVSARQERKSAKGNRFAFIGASDPTGLYEAVVFSDVLEACREYLEPGANVVMQVQVEPQGDEVKMLARSVQPLDRAIANVGPAELVLELGQSVDLGSLQEALERLGEDRGRRGKLILRIHEGDEVYDVIVTDRAPVGPSARQRYRVVPGVLDVLEQ